MALNHNEFKSVPITPLFDRVLLKPLEEIISKNGIYVSRDATERSLVMKVVSVGDGKTESGGCTEMCVMPGEKVVVSKYAGTEVMCENEKFWILKHCDILAKISE